MAFGVLSLKDMYKEMSPSELRDREDFVILASKLMYERLLGQEVWQRLGFPHDECEAAVKASPIMAMFRKLCFSNVSDKRPPNIVKQTVTCRRFRGFTNQLPTADSWLPDSYYQSKH